MSERIFLPWLVLFCWVLATVSGSRDTCWTEGIFRQKRYASCPGCRESWAGAIHAPWYGGSFQPESPARELRGLERGWAKNQPEMLSVGPRGRRSEGLSAGEKKCKRENPFSVYESRAADPYSAVAPSTPSYPPGNGVRSAFPAEEEVAGKGLDLGFRDLFRTKKNQQVSGQDGAHGASLREAVNGRGRTPGFQELIARTFNNDPGTGLSRPSDYANLVNQGLAQGGGPPSRPWPRPPYSRLSFLDLIGRPTTPRFPGGFTRSTNPQEDLTGFDTPRKDQKREDSEYEPQEKVLVVYRADEYPQDDSSEEVDRYTGETQLPQEFYSGTDQSHTRQGFLEQQYRSGPPQDQIFRASEVVHEPEIRHNPFNLPRDLNILEFVQGIQRQSPFDNGKWQEEVHRLVHDGLTEGSRVPQIIEDFEEVVQKREYSPGDRHVLDSSPGSVPVVSNHRIDEFPEDEVVDPAKIEGSSGGSTAEKIEAPRNSTDSTNFQERRSDVYEDGVENPPEESTEPVKESSNVQTNEQR